MDILLFIVMTVNQPTSVVPTTNSIQQEQYFEPKSGGSCTSKDANGGQCAAGGSY